MKFEEQACLIVFFAYSSNVKKELDQKRKHIRWVMEKYLHYCLLHYFTNAKDDLLRWLGICDHKNFSINISNNVKLVPECNTIIVTPIITCVDCKLAWSGEIIFNRLALQDAASAAVLAHALENLGTNSKRFAPSMN